MKGQQTLIFGEFLEGNIDQNCVVPEARMGAFALDLLSGRVVMNELGLVVDTDHSNRNSLSGFGANDLYLVVLQLQVQSVVEEPSRAFMCLHAFDQVATSAPLAHGVGCGGDFVLPATDFATFTGVGTFSPVASGGARLFGHLYLHTRSNFRYLVRITQLN